VNTLSDNVVKHSLAYPSVQKWFAKDALLRENLAREIGPNWPILFYNADFQSIFARSASALTPSESFN